MKKIILTCILIVSTSCSTITPHNHINDPIIPSTINGSIEIYKPNIIKPNIIKPNIIYK